jgi:hypothetical protein
MTRYFMLGSYLGGYMHVDWHDEYPDEWAALDGFLADGPPENAQTFSADIASLLADYPAEDDVRRIIFDDLGSGYLAEVNGWKYRDWLQALSDHAAKSVGHPQAS